MKYLKKMIGEKVFLSPHNPEDYERFTEWVNDPEVSINTTFMYQIISLIKEQSVLNDFAEGKQPSFAICDKETGKPIGACGLFDLDFVNRKATLGIFIGDHNYWNGGYGTDAVKLLLDFGFNVMNLNNINLRVLDFNKRAQRCYEKCGFQITGKIRQGYFVSGAYHDELVYDILASEFQFSSLKDILDKTVNETHVSKLSII